MPKGERGESTIYRVLICGSREWDDRRAIRDLVESLEPGTEVVVGGARGADKIAEEYALARGDLVVRVMRAEWDLYGKAAGFKRNLEMLSLDPAKVYAFIKGRSVGTRHTVAEAEKRGIPVQLTVATA